MGCANARQHTGEGKQSASSKPNGRNTSQGAPKQREGGAGKKHLRSNIDDDEFHDQRDEQDRKRRRLRSPYDGDNEATCRKLACPYFKHDPSRYGSRGSCSGPGWSNVHRMKEHLYRCHARPITCFRCQRPFRSDSELLEHQQAVVPCERSASTPAEGFSKEQERELRRKEYSACSEEEKWRKIYKILFPEVLTNEIPSPYYEHQPRSELLERFRRELPNMVNGVLAALFNDSAIRSRIQDLIQIAYHEFEQRLREEQPFLEMVDTSSPAPLLPNIPVESSVANANATSTQIFQDDQGMDSGTTIVNLESGPTDLPNILLNWESAITRGEVLADSFLNGQGLLPEDENWWH